MEGLEEIRERLRWDTPLWAEHCARIVTTAFKVVPLVPHPWQLELDAKLEAQRLAGRPQRAIILKARKLGFSTWVQAKMLQRATQFENMKALTVAHDGDTAAELFDIGLRIYDELDEEPWLKPPLSKKRNSMTTKYLEWECLHSSYRIDTAKDVEGGRGYTPSMLHLSEFAFYEQVRKLVALMNAVPDTPETMVVIESTAKGFNHFRRAWKAAEQGESDYVTVFAPWWRYDEYRRPFQSDDERDDFDRTFGRGEIGEEEPMLVERFGCTPEQLMWRRRAIVEKCGSDVENFHQEYPSTPDEAFLNTGRPVFSPVLISATMKRVEETDPEFPAPRLAGKELAEVNARRAVRGHDKLKPCPPDATLGPCPACGALHGPHVGVLKETGSKTLRTREGTVEVPTGAVWVPREATGFDHRHPFWRVWEQPVDPAIEDELPDADRSPLRPGQYVVSVDVSGGEEMTTTGERAYNAIQVIDHRSREQVASWRSRWDPHELVREVYLAAIYYNTAIVGVEVTGNWGWPVVRRLNREYRYPSSKLYKRPAVGSAKEQALDRLGWDTNAATKPDMEAYMIELLSGGRAGIRCRLTAGELPTHVRDERGRTGPEADEFNDLLMAYMQGQAIAREIRPKPNRRPGETVNVRAGARSPHAVRR